MIALPCMVYAMDLTVLNLAIPTIAAQFKPSNAQLLWIIDIYGFLVAGLLITMGTLGDRLGRRRLLLAGAAAFALASICAAFADSAGMLIAMRALLGVAGATLAPSTMSLLRNMFHDERERQFAIGVWIAAFSAGSALGPMIGGLLLQYFWWGSVFLAAVPAMLLLLVLGPRLLPEYRDPAAGSIDTASVVLSLTAVLGFVYGVKHLTEHGVQAHGAIAVLAGLALGVAFARRQSRIAYPLLDLRLFRIPRFVAAICAYGLSCLAMFGLYIFITQYLQSVLGLPPLQAGLATMQWSAAFIVGSLGTGALTARLAPSTVLTAGLALSTTGFVLIALAQGPWALSLLIAGTIVMSLGMAPVFTVANEMMITSAPPERAGAASAVAETASELSGAMGIALVGCLGALVYRTGLADALPAAIGAAQRAEALATLGGALAVAAALPGGQGDALAGGARGAFTDALQVAAIAGAATVALAALIAAGIFRKPTAPAAARGA